MAFRIQELFGLDATDRALTAADLRDRACCPFLGTTCVKTLSDRTPSGVCSLSGPSDGMVIACPIRMYADDYKILKDVALHAFGRSLPFVSGATATEGSVSGERVVVFGKRFGGELRLPGKRGRGKYFVEWILARQDASGELAEFVAVEVQTIDTTGNYRGEREALMTGQEFEGKRTAGLNWENVNKRILPQLIYKGHVLRREPLCQKGLYFVCPTQIYDRVIRRLGGALHAYRPQPGSLTFLWYGLGESAGPGQPRPLSPSGSFTTTIDQVALAFTSPSDLPPEGVYEAAIRAGLGRSDS